MSEHDVVKQSAELLKGIIRSIDKRLEFDFVESRQEGYFGLKLTTRGRVGDVMLQTRDLQLALSDDVRRNSVRQKIKHVRDRLLSNYEDDITGTKMARMLKGSASSDDSRGSFYRRPQGRR